MNARAGMGVLLASIIAALVACTSPTTSVNELPVTVDLAVGNRVSLVDRGITLRFDGVVTDNRCPMGALCIVAGQAVLSFSLTGPRVPPVTRRPIKWVGRHPVQRPLRSSRSPSPARRSVMRISAKTRSAVHSVSTSGVLVTTISCASAARRSILSMPTPKLAMILARIG